MLKISLGPVPNLEIVEAVSDSISAIDGAIRPYRDLILMDIELGSDPTGIAIKLEHPYMGIVILASHHERHYLSLIAAKESSGRSYLLKQSVTDSLELARTIEGASSGLVIMDPTVVNR